MITPQAQNFVNALIDNIPKRDILSVFSHMHYDTPEEQQKTKDHFPTFFRKVFYTLNPATKYLHNWHIDAISEHLMACWKREILRLQINIPPRYMKSTLVSIAFPAFVLGHNPSEQFLCASHSKALALEHSVSCRTVMQSKWYKAIFTAAKIRSGQAEKRKFTTLKGGHRIATSVGASTIGLGGNFLIADDLIDPERSYSDQHRHVANRYYDQSFSTRLNDKKTGVIIIIMQRLHEDDPCGHALTQEEWTRLVIPAESDKRRIYNIGKYTKVFEKDEVLHPEREGKEELDTAKVKLGSYGYSAQYLQTPTPLEGGLVHIDWFRRYKTLPDAKEITMVIQVWDTAQKTNEILNDPWVCGTWLITYTHYYLAHVYRDWMNYPTGKRKVKELWSIWRPNTIIIEDKSTGSSLIQELSGLPVIPYEPEGDKLERLSSESPTIESGLCYLPEEADWLFEFEQEIKFFPNSTYKDQVDMLSCFLRYMNKRSIRWENFGLGNRMETA